MDQKLLSRRTLLKSIFAGSGAIAAASFLPEKWLKPVVHSGVLPVHAQASGIYSVTTQQSGSTVGIYVTTGPAIFTSTGSYKVASPVKAQCPSNGVQNVSVTISASGFTMNPSQKLTDSCGYVSWNLCHFSPPFGTNVLVTFTTADGSSTSVTVTFGNEC